MRRFALLGPVLLMPGLLAGCTGMGVFFDHTFTFFGENPNAPAGSSENLLRVHGRQVAIMPLLPEPGNVWPGPQAPDPTLSDIEQQQNRENARGFPATSVPNPGLPAGAEPRPVRPPDGSGPAGSPQSGALPDGALPNAPPPPRSSVPRSPQGGVINTPRGPAVGTGGGNGQPVPYKGGIIVPNGNGTSTWIGPDGSIQTVPTPSDLTAKPSPLPRSSTPGSPSGDASPGGASPGGAPPGGIPYKGGIIVPNGNGTSTWIGPDGKIETVPTPAGIGPTAPGPQGAATNGSAGRVAGGVPYKGGIIVPNGDGTSTWIGPDGKTETVPTPPGVTSTAPRGPIPAKQGAATVPRPNQFADTDRTATAAEGVPYKGGIIVPNGNGTSTWIGPDGTIKTVPTPK